ncbi:MAG: tetratricopeptide repeat protein [Bacteroidota bacterium]
MLGITFFLLLSSTFQADSIQMRIDDAKELLSKDPKQSIVLVNELYDKLGKSDAKHSIQLMNVLGEAYYLIGQYDSGIYYSYQSKYILEKNAGVVPQPRVFELLAINYYGLHEYDSAIHYYQVYSSALGPEEMKLKARTLRNIAIAYGKMDNLEACFAFLYQALEMSQSIGSQKDIGKCYNSLASLFRRQNDYANSMRYHRKALQIFEELPAERKSVGRSLNNIGNLFRDMEQYDSATKYLMQSIEIKQLDDSLSLPTSYQNLGMVQMKLRQFNKALNSINTSIEIAKQHKQSSDLISGYIDLAELHLELGRLNQAKLVLDTAQTLSLEIKSPEKRSQIYLLLSHYYELSKGYQKSLAYLRQYRQLKDSLVNEAKVSAISKLQVQFDTREKERSLSLLNEKNKTLEMVADQKDRFLWLLGASSIVFLILSVLAYKSYRSKRKAHDKVELLLRELHHRVKNNLQIVSSLLSLQSENIEDLEAKKAIKEGEMRINAMNLLHQRLYMDGTTVDVDIKDYLQELLEDIKMAYSEKSQYVNVNMAIDPIRLDVDCAIPLALITNELVSNSFKHAFQHSDKGEIDITLQGKAEKVVMKISDNGPGFKPMQTNLNKSFGLRMVDIFATQMRAAKEVLTDMGTAYIFTINLNK